MSPLNRLQRFRTSFRSRIFLAFTLLTALIALAFMAITISNENSNYRQRSDEKAKLLASMLADNARLPLFAGNLLALEKLADDLLENARVAQVVIADHENRPLVDRSSTTLKGSTALVTGRAPVKASALAPSLQTALTGVPETAAAPLGSVAVSIDASDLRRSLLSTVLRTGVLVLVFWIAVLTAIHPVLKRITRSFEALIKGLDTVMTGDFSVKIEVDSDDEAGRATQSVNRLAAALEERETENRNLHAELLRSMQLEMQEEKRKMVAKMIQTNRMTSLGLLISSMAHNINTPNGAIKLAAQHIQRTWKDVVPLLETVAREEGDFLLGGLRFSEAKGEFGCAAESISHNAERIERVIQDLRAYNVGERSELAPGVSINQAVEGALTIIRAHGRQAQVTVSTLLTPDLPTIVGNKHQIEQVVVNLILNAMQATPDEGGTVLVETRYQAADNEVLIVITDQGEGIPDIIMQHLFEPFTSTRVEKGGSGLGLYISNFIVTEHNGSISFRTTKSAGTTVTVHLPAEVTP